MANNPYVNKVQLADGNTLIDLTSTTATADKILTGFGAFGADGAWMSGTATGGGSVTQDQDGFIVLPPDGGGSPSASGLEYETGEINLSASQAGLSISFMNSHSSPPIFFTVARQTSGQTFQNYNQAVQTISGAHFVNALNVSTIETKSSNPYHFDAMVVRSMKSSTALSHTAINCTTDGATTWAQYATSSGLYLNTADNYQAGTYKWIAVWAPTT